MSAGTPKNQFCGIIVNPDMIIPESRAFFCRLRHGQGHAKVSFWGCRIGFYLIPFFFIFLCGFVHGQPDSNPYINDISLDQSGMSLSAFWGNKELKKFYDITKDAKNATELLFILLRHSTTEAIGLPGIKSGTKNGFCSENEQQPFDTDLRARKPIDSSEAALVSELLDRIIFLKNSGETLYIYFCLDLYGMGFSGTYAENGIIVHRPHHYSEWSFTMNMVNHPSFNKRYDRPAVLFKQIFDGSRLSSLKYNEPMFSAWLTNDSHVISDDTTISVDWESSENIGPFDLIDFPLPFLGRVGKKDDIYGFYDFEICNDKDNEDRIQLIAYPKEKRGDLIKEIKISLNSHGELCRIEYTGITDATATVVIVSCHRLVRQNYTNTNTRENILACPTTGSFCSFFGKRFSPHWYVTTPVRCRAHRVHLRCF